jgi:hypothetical protein
MDSDLRAEMADWVAGVLGGETCVELGREGEARGMISRCSGGPENNGYCGAEGPLM